MRGVLFGTLCVGSALANVDDIQAENEALKDTLQRFSDESTKLEQLVRNLSEEKASCEDFTETVTLKIREATAATDNCMQKLQDAQDSSKTLVTGLRQEIEELKIQNTILARCQEELNTTQVLFSKAQEEAEIQKESVVRSLNAYKELSQKKERVEHDCETTMKDSETLREKLVAMKASVAEIQEKAGKADELAKDLQKCSLEVGELKSRHEEAKKQAMRCEQERMLSKKTNEDLQVSYGLFYSRDRCITDFWRLLQLADVSLEHLIDRNHKDVLNIASYSFEQLQEINATWILIARESVSDAWKAARPQLEAVGAIVKPYADGAATMYDAYLRDHVQLAKQQLVEQYRRARMLAETLATDIQPVLLQAKVTVTQQVRGLYLHPSAQDVKRRLYRIADDPRVASQMPRSMSDGFSSVAYVVVYVYVCIYLARYALRAARWFGDFAFRLLSTALYLPISICLLPFRCFRRSKHVKAQKTVSAVKNPSPKRRLKKTLLPSTKNREVEQ